MRKNKSIVANNAFMIKYIWKASKSYVLLKIVQNSLLPTVVEVFNILVFKYIFDLIELGEGMFNVIVALISITIVQLLSSITEAYMNNLLSKKTSFKLSALLNEELMEKAVRLDYCCYDDNSFYDTFTKALSEVDGRAITVLNNLTNMLRNLLMIVSIIGIIITLNPIMFVFVGVATLIRIFFFPKQNKLLYEYNQKKAPIERKNSFLKRVFYSPQYAMEMRTAQQLIDIFKEKYFESTSENITTHQRIGRKTFKISMIVEIVEKVFIILLPYLYLCILAFKKIISLGGLTALYSSMQTSAYAITDFFANINSIVDSNLYIENLKKVMNMEQKIDNGEGEIFKDNISSIEFSSVSFSYKDVCVLKNVSFKINEGEKIALVGHNGAGKTTIIKLLLRLYEPQEGTIFVNGVDIKQYEVRSLRRRIFAMNQNFSIFPIPIIENIIIKKEINAYEEKMVENLVKKFEIFNEEEDIHKKIYSCVSKEFDPNGVVFSGGEMQKIAILRAICNKTASLMIFDEPSSALDPLSENVFYEQLLSALENRTSVIITHRLSSLAIVDKVLFLQDGQVAGYDSLNQLLLDSEEFKNYYNSQAKYYINIL